MALQTTKTTRSKAAAKTRRAKEKPESDLDIISRADDGSTFVARLFGEEEEFTFSTDMNSWLVLALSSGDPKAAVDLVYSVIEVVPEDDEDVDAATRRVKNDFNTVMGRQKNLDFERLFRFINDLIEAAAGNEESTS